MFVGQLTKKVTEKKVRAYFETVGKVNDVIMIRDRATDRHKVTLLIFPSEIALPVLIFPIEIVFLLKSFLLF